MDFPEVNNELVVELGLNFPIPLHLQLVCTNNLRNEDAIQIRSPVANKKLTRKN